MGVDETRIDDHALCIDHLICLPFFVIIRAVHNLSLIRSDRCDAGSLPVTLSPYGDDLFVIDQNIRFFKDTVLAVTCHDIIRVFDQ